MEQFHFLLPHIMVSLKDSKPGIVSEYILERVSASIKEQTEKLVSQKSNLLPFPAPLYSVFMSDCIEKGLELSHGAKYNNFGIHGAGSANAADALAAVRTFVFDEESIESQTASQCYGK